MAVDINYDPVFEVGTPKKLFNIDYINVGTPNFGVFPDGTRFAVINRPESKGNENQINIIINFLEELKQLVPVEKK